MNTKKFITIGIIAVSLMALVLFVFYGNRNVLRSDLDVFSKNNMLQSLWYHYKIDYLEKDSLRALDKQRNNITTSEGQSYSMLRAVWMNDKPVFDKVWQFTKDNFQHKENDKLISWLFGQKEDGTYGIIESEGGNNTATDADVDIALALLFASRRWNDETYKGDALVIINDIWINEVVNVQGKNYLAALNLEKFDTEKSFFILNPSYFAPYAYRIFAEVDPAHPWLDLVDTSYEVLNKNIDLNLDKNITAGLPSDWVAIDKISGEIIAVPYPTTLKTDFSFDALRIPWRLALDDKWFQEDRAKSTLSKLSFLKKQWVNNNKISTHYDHAGKIINKNESSAMYGGIIGYFMLEDSQLAEQVYLEKLESLYNPDKFTWHRELGYYDANWAWFGIALYNDLLPNLYPVSVSKL
ncbi:MAG: glycosyl hydrolase family 8 [bacterium]|nr:glycosyl hydrolase family 8 [bacterium]